MEARRPRGFLIVEHTTFVLYEKHNAIGRDPKLTVNIKCPAVSSLHAVITINKNAYLVSDFNSTNGTVHNGRPLVPYELSELKDGDEIVFGNKNARFHYFKKEDCKDVSNFAQSQLSQTFFEQKTQVLFSDVVERQVAPHSDHLYTSRSSDFDFELHEAETQVVVINKVDETQICNRLEQNSTNAFPLDDLHEIDTQIVYNNEERHFRHEVSFDTGPPDTGEESQFDELVLNGGLNSEVKLGCEIKSIESQENTRQADYLNSKPSTSAALPEASFDGFDYFDQNRTQIESNVEAISNCSINQPDRKRPGSEDDESLGGIFPLENSTESQIKPVSEEVNKVSQKTNSQTKSTHESTTDSKGKQNLSDCETEDELDQHLDSVTSKETFKVESQKRNSQTKSNPDSDIVSEQIDLSNSETEDELDQHVTSEKNSKVESQKTNSQTKSVDESSSKIAISDSQVKSVVIQKLILSDSLTEDQQLEPVTCKETSKVESQKTNSQAKSVHESTSNFANSDSEAQPVVVHKLVLSDSETEDELDKHITPATSKKTGKVESQKTNTQTKLSRPDSVLQIKPAFLRKTNFSDSETEDELDQHVTSEKSSKVINENIKELNGDSETEDELELKLQLVDSTSTKSDSIPTPNFSPISSQPEIGPNEASLGCDHTLDNCEVFDDSVINKSNDVTLEIPETQYSFREVSIVEVKVGLNLGEISMIDEDLNKSEDSHDLVIDESTQKDNEDVTTKQSANTSKVSEDSGLESNHEVTIAASSSFKVPATKNCEDLNSSSDLYDQATQELSEERTRKLFDDVLPPTQALEKLHEEENSACKVSSVEDQLDDLFATQSDTFQATQELVSVLEKSNASISEDLPKQLVKDVPLLTQDLKMTLDSSASGSELEATLDPQAKKQINKKDTGEPNNKVEMKTGKVKLTGFNNLRSSRRLGNFSNDKNEETLSNTDLDEGKDSYNLVIKISTSIDANTSKNGVSEDPGANPSFKIPKVQRNKDLNASVDIYEQATQELNTECSKRNVDDLLPPTQAMEKLHEEEIGKVSSVEDQLVDLFATQSDTFQATQDLVLVLEKSSTSISEDLTKQEQDLRKILADSSASGSELEATISPQAKPKKRKSDTVELNSEVKMKKRKVESTGTTSLRSSRRFVNTSKDKDESLVIEKKELAKKSKTKKETILKKKSQSIATSTRSSTVSKVDSVNKEEANNIADTTTTIRTPATKLDSVIEEQAKKKIDTSTRGSTVSKLDDVNKEKAVKKIYTSTRSSAVSKLDSVNKEEANKIAATTTTTRTPVTKLDSVNEEQAKKKIDTSTRSFTVSKLDYVNEEEADKKIPTKKKINTSTRSSTVTKLESVNKDEADKKISTSTRSSTVSKLNYVKEDSAKKKTDTSTSSTVSKIDSGNEDQLQKKPTTSTRSSTVTKSDSIIEEQINDQPSMSELAKPSIRKTTKRKLNASTDPIQLLIPVPHNEEKVQVKRRSKAINANLSSVTIPQIVESPNRSRRNLKPKVVFSMVNDSTLESIVRQLGGKMTDTVDTCTVLVTSALKRTEKVLCAIAKGKPICDEKWLQASKKNSDFLDPWDFLIGDKVAEEKWQFSIKESILRGQTGNNLLSGYTFQIVVTDAVQCLKGAIEACGGKVVTRGLATAKSENKFIIATVKNKAKYSKIANDTNQIRVVEPEAIFDGTLRQDFKFENFLLPL